MDVDPALPDTLAPPSAAPAAAVARLEGQLVLLERLSEIGMTLAESIARQVAPLPTAPSAMPAPPLFRGDIVLAFSRVARAIRLTVALQFKLVAELDAWRRGEPPQTAQTTTQAAEADRDEASAPEPEADPREAVEAGERFGDREREAGDDIYAVLRRPTDEVIDLIRRDLGLGPEWVRQVREEWAHDQAAARDAAEPALAIPDAPPRQPHRPNLRGPPKPPERWPRPAPS